MLFTNLNSIRGFGVWSCSKVGLRNINLKNRLHDMIIHFCMEAFEYIHSCNRKDMEEFFRLNMVIETREENKKDTNEKNKQSTKNVKGERKNSGTKMP